MQLNWTIRSFNELGAAELYAIMQLRNEVFVVEQNCVYQDADNRDQQSLHFCGWQEGKLLAYTRIIPPGFAYEEASIGRVVTSPLCRRTGIGRVLMQKSIANTFNIFKCSRIRIGAQVYLTAFYASLGFVATGEPYLEDGIPHIEMILNK
jgi:ElaA protein